jgi:abequosyltransferase
MLMSFVMPQPIPPKLSVCIPAYGRVREYTLLLQSLLLQTSPPDEILICEDGSKERAQLKSITLDLVPQFSDAGCNVRFIENPNNLGYDANLRELIKLAKFEYVVFIGNDDYFLSDGIENLKSYLSLHKVLACSRSFSRFHTDPLQPVGFSRVFKTDTILNKATYPAGMMVRVGGFFGGLVFDRAWANSKNTTQYDGSLFYQIYLLFVAYTEGNIGYVSTPLVAARADNAPLFGNSESEKLHFVPGRYTAESRGRMWAEILRIATDCENKAGIPILESVKKELSGRMSFHVFEMFAGRPSSELNALRTELVRLNLFDDLTPKFLFWFNKFLGGKSIYGYILTRKIFQK